MNSPRKAPRAGLARTDHPLPGWAVLCFFMSGAAGLLYEVVWTKQLAYLLGNSLHATATVVAAFLGGLAIGALFLGTPLARRGRGVRTYAALELCVAAFGLAWLPLLRSLDPAVGTMYRALGGEGAAFAAARFVLLFVTLVPPAAVMGATLPVLVAHFDRERVGAGLARLYALNTIGAVAGSFAGGFALLPTLGLSGATWVAACVNVGVALLAWRAGGDAPAAIATPGPPRDARETERHVRAGSTATPAAPRPVREAERRVPAAGLPAARHLVFAVLFGASGFVALLFQIAWVRLFGMVFGSSVYSFSAVLGVYLLGLAAGSMAGVPLVRRGATPWHFARLQLALALSAAVVLHAFRWLPEWMLRLGALSGSHWVLLLAGEIATVGLLVFVPCALLGTAFPVATQLLQRDDTGHAIGLAYGINTLGTIAGTLAGGFLLVPWWGVQGTHLAALLLALAIGLASLAIEPPRGPDRARRLGVSIAVVAAIAALAAFAPRWDPSLMASGTYRPSQARLLDLRARERGGGGPAVVRATRGLQLLLYREGINGSVVVEENPETGNRLLRVGGKVDASTGDMETQVLLGLLPAACADSGARTLVVGLGSGITLAAALAAGAGVTDVVELEPAIVQASRFFHDRGRDPLDDPRTRLILGDARTRLAYAAGRYEMIVSQPSNPWVAGENSLFTMEFYRLVRSRLEPGGVFCQWIQSYELSRETFDIMLGSFLSVFPQGHAFAIWAANDVLLIAMPANRGFDLGRLRGLDARRLLERARIGDPQELVGYYAASFATLRDSVRTHALNRDDRPIVEYRAPRDLIRIGHRAAHEGRDEVSLMPFQDAPPGGALFAAWPVEGWIEARVRSLARHGAWEHASRAARGARAIGFDGLAARLEREVADGRRRSAVAEELQRAAQLGAEGRDAEATLALERATRADSGDASLWLRLAVARRRANDPAGAARALAGAGVPRESRLRAEAELMAGLLAFDRRQVLEAATHFREAQRWDPERSTAYVFEARALDGAGDRAGALSALRRGFERCPGDSELVAVAATLGYSTAPRRR